MDSSPEYRNIFKDRLVVGPIGLLALGGGALDILMRVKPELQVASPLILRSVHVIAPSAAIAATLSWPVLTIERFGWFNSFRQRVGHMALAGQVSMVGGFGVHSIYDTEAGQRHVASWIESLVPIIPPYAPASSRDLLIGMATSMAAGLYMGWQYKRCNSSPRY